RLRLGRRHRAAGAAADHHVRAGPLRRQEGELRLMSTPTLRQDPHGPPSAPGEDPSTGSAPAPGSAVRNRGRDRGPRRPRWATARLVGGVLAPIAVSLVPLYWLFSSGRKPHQQVYTWPLRWSPEALTCENFTQAWNSAPFDR